MTTLSVCKIWLMNIMWTWANTIQKWFKVSRSEIKRVQSTQEWIEKVSKYPGVKWKGFKVSRSEMKRVYSIQEWNEKGLQYPGVKWKGFKVSRSEMKRVYSIQEWNEKV